MPRRLLLPSLLLVLMTSACDGRVEQDSSAPARAPTIDEAIAAASRYFVRSTDQRWAEIGILTQFVARKFGDVLDLEPVPFPSRSQLGDVWIVVSRFADPRYPMTVEEIKANPNPINQMTTAALYCDVIPLPPSYPETLRQANELAALHLTHGVMATYWAVENGCLRLDELPIEILDDQVDGLVTIANWQKDNFRDLGIEAVAFLAYIGRSGLIRDAWIEQILRQQNPDGGWGGYGIGSASDPHASMLALWVLLERRHPGRPGKWLPRW